MAIHIDIYAHLRKEQLIKEGEQLRRYVESLENDANKRLERGAQGLSNTVIALNDKQAKSYDGLINAHDTFIKSKKRRKEVEKQLLSIDREILKAEEKIEKLAGITRKTTKAQINLEKQREEAAERRLKLDAARVEVAKDLESAEQDLVYASQRYTAAANDRTRAQSAVNQEEEAHLGLLKENQTHLHRLSAATIKHRRDLEDLHRVNTTAIKDNTNVAKGLERVSAATKKTTEERKRYKEMVKEGIAGHRELLQQTNRVTAAHEAENKIIGEVTENIKGLGKQHKLSRVAIDANQTSLRDYAKSAAAARREIKDLSVVHATAIGSNAKLARSFGVAEASTKAALREHKEYKKLIRDGADQDTLVRKAERVADAYERQRNEVAAARDGLAGLLHGQSEADAFIRSQATNMRNYAQSALLARNEISHLRGAHQYQIRDSAALTRSFNAVDIATKKAIDSHQEYNRLVARGAGRDDLEKQAKKTTEAYQDQARRVDEASEALKRNNKERANDRIRGLTGGMGEYASRNINALLPGGRLNAGVMLPLAAIAGSMAEAGVTASQSLALLPALAASGAAAIGTLAIGMHGFIDTVGDMADPKKFAEGLALLSPNAQQAAIEVKALVDGPLGDLKALTQDNLFAGVAQQIHSLTGEFGPELSQLFGGLATEMNKAFMGVTNILMTPEAQASIGNTIDSIVEGFQHLMPMLGPLTTGLLKLTEVGSSFLPQVGDIFTDLATRFNNLIQTSAADGSLQNFFQKGIDAARYLIDFIVDIGKKIYETFGNTSVAEFRNTLETVKEVIFDIGKAIAGMARLFNALMPVLDGIADSIGGWEVLMGGFIAIWAGAKLRGPIMWVVKMLGKAGVGGALSALPGTADKAATGVSAALGRIKIPPALMKILGVTGVAAAAAAVVGGAASAAGVGHEGVTERKSGSVDWLPDAINPGVIFNPNNWIDNALGKFDTPPAAPAGPTRSGPGVGGLVAPWNTAPAQPGGWFPQPVPTHTDPGDFQSTPGTFELANIPVGQFGGAQWNVPQGVTDLPPDYENIGKTGYYRTDPMKIMQETADAESARVTAEEKRKKYLATLADVNHTQDDISSATQDVIDAEQNYLQSIRNMKEAERGEFEDLTGQMDDFGNSLKDALGGLGVALDDDLGISDGLAGLAENAVKFFATLGAAPVLGAMKGMQAGLGYPNNEDNGSGLVGIAGALSGHYNAPANYKEQAELANAQYGINQFGLGTVTPGGLGPAVGPLPSASPGEDARSFAHRAMKPFFESQGFTVGDHAADAHGEHQNGALDIMVNSIAEGQNVLNQVLKDPNVYGAIFNNKSYGYGNGPGGQDYSGGFTGDPTQDHQDHVHAWYKPGGKNNITPGGMGLPGVPAAAGGGLPGSLYQDASGKWQSSLPGWNHLINRESSGVNQKQGIVDANSGGNEAEGLFQITPQTWNANGGSAYAPSALGATPQQQAEIAANIFRANPSGGDWGMGLEGRENPAQLMAELTGAGPSNALAGALGIPTGATAGLPGAAGPSGSAVPVFVTNWPGGGAFGGGAPGAAGAGTPHGGTGAAPGPAGAPHGGTGAAPGPTGGGGGTSGGPGVADRNTPAASVPAGGGNFLAEWRNDIGAAPVHGVQGIDAGAALLNGLGQPLTVPTGLSGDEMLAWLKQNPNHVLPGGGGPSSLPAIDNIANSNVPGTGRPGTNPLDVFAPTMQSLWNPLTSPAGGARNGEVPIVAHSGEHMLTREDVTAMGGQRGVYDFRNALHYEGGGAIDQILGGVTGTSQPPGSSAPKSAAGMLPTNSAKDYLKALQAPPAGTPTKDPMKAPLGLPAATPTKDPMGAPLGIPSGAPGSAPAVPPGALGVPAPATPALTPGGIATPGGVATQGTTIGANPEVDPDTGYGEGLNISGGALGAITGAASSAAGMAADAFAPGSGAAASAAIQIGIQEIQRAIEFGAQAAGIGIQGLQQTFLPSGGSELANNSWLTRIVGGVVGSAPALANTAGKAAAGAPLGQGANLPGVGPATPEQIAAQGMDPNRIQHTGTGPAPGPVSNTGVRIENYFTTDNRAASQDFGRYALPGAR